VEAAIFHEASGEPHEAARAGKFKALRDIARLLTMTTRRDASVSHESGTVEKASLMTLTSILFDCGYDDAKIVLDHIQSLICEVLKDIADAPDPVLALDETIRRFSSEDGKPVLTLHRTTVAEMIPHADRAQLDAALMEQYKDCMNELDESGAKSSALILAADETHEKVRSKYYNGNYSYVVVGQTSTWQRGFVYPTGYDATHQLFMGSRHRDYRLIDSEKKALRPWLRDIAAKCTMARELGIDQILIEGDRTYYNGEIFAAAALGLIDPDAPPGHQPRVIAPKKLTTTKDDIKWQYLLDTTKPQVFTDYIQLNPYRNPALRQACEKAFQKTKNYHFLIPFTCVAMVDEYSLHEKRTLDEVRARALVVQAGIYRETNNLARLIESYQSTSEAEDGKKVPAPSFGRGGKRKRFPSEKVRHSYDDCFKCHERLARWEKEKASLLKTLMYFAISIVPGDDPVQNPSMFIAFAQDYHERWGIENGFRDVKGRFLVRARSRRPVIRQFHLIAGMMLYNRWEVERKHAISTARETRFLERDANCEARPWVRQKFEKEYHNLPTAVGFLADCWSTGILSLLKGDVLEKK
jgi:hypothetical protein